MQKTRKVMEIEDRGQHYKVIFDTTRKDSNGYLKNPYRIYKIQMIPRQYGVTESKKLMESYANLQSCFYWFIENGIGTVDVFRAEE